MCQDQNGHGYRVPLQTIRKPCLFMQDRKELLWGDSNQVEAPNKKYIVSQDDKENSDILAAVGS